jgi:DinB superfamily
MEQRAIARSPSWDRALREHAEVEGQFRRALLHFPDDGWQRPPSPGRWSAAALTLHVCQSYEMGVTAARGGPSMRLVSPRPVALLSRCILLPILLATRRFPAEAPAPTEVLPDLGLAASIGRDAAITRFTASAAAAREALSSPGAHPVTHAYFGTLHPMLALRLLSAHTRHHTGGLIERLAGR